ncbi:MAG: glycosyltransferase [Chloroflexi bacterium]|nr:glycosyltransferase [Chloroflexota bacterium]
MSVCLVNLVDLDPPRNGGLSRIAYVVCNLLAEWAEQGKVTVYFAVGWRFSGQFRAWLGRSGGELIPVLPDAGMTPVFETLRPDLIISPLFGMKPVSDWVAYQKTPHIASIPDALALDMPALFPAAEAQRRRDIYLQLKNASTVVTISDDARNRLVKHIGLKRAQTLVIPLAGDLPVQDAPVEAGDYQSPLGKIGLSPYVLYPARNWPHKRHELLLRSFREILRSRSDLKLVLTGWHDEGYLNLLIARHNLPRESVLDLGYVSNADMESLYRGAEALLFVSEYEGFGMPILEAMQNDCPVICAPLTSMPEVGGSAALYVDSHNPKDWANAFIKDLPNLRDELIRKGRRQAKKFSWDKTRSMWSELMARHLKSTRLRKNPVSLPYAQEMQTWANRHQSDQDELVKKERVIQMLNDGMGRLQQSEAENHQLRQQINQMDLTHLQQIEQLQADHLHRVAQWKKKNSDLQNERKRLVAENKQFKKEIEHARSDNERLLAENQQLMAQTAEKEQIIQKFRTSFIYRMDNGPLRSFSIFPLLRWAAIWLRDIRRIFLPKVGVLHQHAPIPLDIPKRYYNAPSIKAEDAPRISITTPSYNQAAFIERTARSVLDQGYPNLEYVIQDGGSRDATVKVMKPFLSRLTHFESRKDDGQAHAINMGFAHTSGEIMAYLNSDDILLPGALNYVADYFTRHPDVDVIYGHRIIIDENDGEIGRWILPPHDNDVILWADYVPQETLFWRRSIWEKSGGQMDESFQFALDWDLLIRFREAGAKIVRAPRFLGAFRVQAAQKTSAHMESSGMKEMNRLRRQVHGRDVSWQEILKNISPYLNRSVIYHKLHWLKILKY